MRRARPFLLAALPVCMAYAAGPGPVVTAEELFKWGEYDSLIRALEPLAAAPGYADHAEDRSDSAARSRNLLYLGVAYYAKGRVERADSALFSACALDPEAELDRFYVTPAIAGHFQGVKTEERRRRQARAEAAPAEAGPASRANALAVRSDRPRPALREPASWLWWGLGAAALAAAGGGAYWIARQPAAPRGNVTTVDVRGAR